MADGRDQPLVPLGRTVQVSHRDSGTVGESAETSNWWPIVTQVGDGRLGVASCY